MKNKCGCEEESNRNDEENLIHEAGCGCGETTNTDQTNEECGCKETTNTDQTNEECGCGETTKPNPTDEGCGCGDEHVESHEEGGCCGDIEIPDLSRKENPVNPKFLAKPNFFKEFEDYVHSLGIKDIRIHFTYI